MHRLDPFGTMEEIGESTVHWCPSDKCRDAKASQLQSNSYVPRSTVFSSFVRVLFCSPFCSVLFSSFLVCFCSSACSCLFICSHIFPYRYRDGRTGIATNLRCSVGFGLWAERISSCWVSRLFHCTAETCMSMCVRVCACVCLGTLGPWGLT